MTITASLPKPKNLRTSRWAESDDEEPPKKTSAIPAYPHRNLRTFTPKTLQDYADGGAYPELKVVQYPLNMGKDPSKKVLPLQTDNTGLVRYDKVIANGKTLAATKESEFITKEITDQDIQKTTLETKDALEKIIEKRIAIAQPNQVNVDKNTEPTYIKYTPEGEETKIVRMAHKQQDPFEPPKFKNRKQPRAPGSPPAPVSLFI
jgi:SNW domain-containing protein 1